MTWRPEPQPPCEPDCTCDDLPAITPEPEPRPSRLPSCGVVGCGYCPPASIYTAPPGGGDRLPNRKATT